jgi:acyl-coenzyme A thioesterase PaaI-like protein
MLYDTMGPALLATLEPDQFQSTLDLKVSFLRPVKPGRIVGRGRVAHRDGDIAYLGDATIATATAIARVIPLTQAKTAV